MRSKVGWGGGDPEPKIRQLFRINSSGICALHRPRHGFAHFFIILLFKNTCASVCVPTLRAVTINSHRPPHVLHLGRQARPSLPHLFSVATVIPIWRLFSIRVWAVGEVPERCVEQPRGGYFRNPVVRPHGRLGDPAQYMGGRYLHHHVAGIAAPVLGVLTCLE